MEPDNKFCKISDNYVQQKMLGNTLTTIIPKLTLAYVNHSVWH